RTVSTAIGPPSSSSCWPDWWERPSPWPSGSWYAVRTARRPGRPYPPGSEPHRPPAARRRPAGIVVDTTFPAGRGRAYPAPMNDEPALRRELALTLLGDLDSLIERLADDICAHSSRYASGTPVSHDDLHRTLRGNMEI